jgi:hypothetical protein
MKQPHAKLGLQKSHPPTDRRLIRAKLHGGPGNAAAFGDLGEECKVI